MACTNKANVAPEGIAISSDVVSVNYLVRWSDVCLVILGAKDSSASTSVSVHFVTVLIRAAGNTSIWACIVVENITLPGNAGSKGRTVAYQVPQTPLALQMAVSDS